MRTSSSATPVSVKAPVGQGRAQVRPLDLKPGFEHRCVGLGGTEELALPKGGSCKKRYLIAGSRGDQAAQAQNVDRKLCAPQADGETVGKEDVAIRIQHLAQLLEGLPKAATGQLFGRRVPKQRGKLFAVHRHVWTEQQKTQKTSGLASAKGDLFAVRKPDGTTASQEVDLKSRHSRRSWKHFLASGCILSADLSTMNASGFISVGKVSRQGRMA